MSTREFVLSVLSVIIAILGVFWTYYLYYGETWRQTAKAIADMSDALVSVQLNCTENDKPLILGTKEKLEPREERCYKSYVSARKKILSASTLIPKRMLTPSKRWEEAWGGARERIAKGGSGGI